MGGEGRGARWRIVAAVVHREGRCGATDCIYRGGGAVSVRAKYERDGMAYVDEGHMGGGSPVPGSTSTANEDNKDDNYEELNMNLALRLMERTDNDGGTK